jgi:hypothetical protein
MKKAWRVALLPVFLVLMAVTSQAMGAKQMHDTVGQNVAIGGYDPVSYFPEGGGHPEKGFVKRTFEYDGVVYRFASDENLESFKAHPQKYLPQYGGWCAWAMAKLAAPVDVDPESYEIRDGKLYLFYRQKELDTRQDWQAHLSELLPQAEANWKKYSNS